MNTAETRTSCINPATQPGVLAPITRIGGGEVRVNRRPSTRRQRGTTATWTGSLSFGYQALDGPHDRQKDGRPQLQRGASTYSIAPRFRYADDAASGAGQLHRTATITVPATAARLHVKMKIDVTKLPTWTLNGAPAVATVPLLQAVEFDGYLDIAGSRTMSTWPGRSCPTRCGGRAGRPPRSP